MSAADRTTRADTTIVTVDKGNDTLAWLRTRTSLDVVPIRHPVIEALGHAPTSDYAFLWLPMVGPATLWTHRLLTAGFTANPEGYRVDLATLSRELSLGAGTGRHSAVARTVSRLVRSDLADIVDDRLGLSTTLPPLTPRHAARLPAHLAARHRQLAQQHQTRRPRSAGITAEARW